MGIAAIEPSAAAEADEKRILIVDDEPGILKFLKKALELSGFAVETASSADQAMEAVVAGGVDLLLTDIKMPGGSGFDLMSLTRLTENGVPIVLMSGHVDIGVMKSKGLREGSVECLNKPFTVQELRDTIEHALARGPVDFGSD